MNIRINTKDLSDKAFATSLNNKAESLLNSSKSRLNKLIAEVHSAIS
jgi:formiminotetrahydrofolate cyclodeaminase